MQINNKEKQREPSFVINQKTVEKVIKIQRAFRRHQLVQTVRRRLKKLKAKAFIANELLTTEKSFCNQLDFIIAQVLVPSRQIINDAEAHELMFCNLQQIELMHRVFEQKLAQRMQQYDPLSTRLSQVLLNDLFLRQDFKQLYSNYCANYKKSNRISKLLFANNSGFNSLLRKVGITDTNSFESYLIKPMQRLCKYELLLNNYLRNMEEEHPDFQDLKHTISHIERQVKETNQQVEEFLLSERYKEILYKYEPTMKLIPNQTRRLLFGLEDMSLIDMINDQSSLCKQLSLFTDSILLIPEGSAKPIFTLVSIVRDLPNLKYFKNLVQLIHGDQYLTIQFKKGKQKDNFLEASKKMDKHGQKSEFVEVSILGTQIRQSLFKKYTVYVVEVKMSNDNVLKTYPRFKDLLSVQEVIDRKKIKINLPSLSKETYFATTKSKTIEKRKLIIQQFLQKLLNSKECLQLPEILKILNISLKQGAKKTEQVIQILLPNLTPVQISIDVKSAKIRELKEAVNYHLGLSHCREFTIMETKPKQRRLMSDDEPVAQIYEYQSAFNFNPFKEAITYVYTRHFYLDADEQFALYKEDFVRTELELSVIREEILKYKLEEELMITFMCLFALYTNLPVQDEARLGKFIKDICKKEYKITKEDFNVYYREVEKKVMEEQDEMATLPFLIIKIISNSVLYRCQQFEVQIHPKSFKAVKTYIEGLEEKVILGVKNTHILLITPESKHTIQSFPMSDFETLEVHPTAIVFQLSNVGPALRLNTPNAFEISELIEIYKGKPGKNSSR